jgi:hypothetical protein
VLYSDAFRQTAADLMQLVRIIEAGVDVDGDARLDLDPSRIYYQGSSWSGGYGTVFMAVEPHVSTAVLKAAADPAWFPSRGPGNRRVPGGFLAARQPSLLNAPGIKALDGVAAFAGGDPIRWTVDLSGFVLRSSSSSEKKMSDVDAVGISRSLRDFQTPVGAFSASTGVAASTSSSTSRKCSIA